MSPRTENISIRLLVTAALVIWLTSASVETGRALPQQEALPKAEEILDQYVEAVGGLATLEKISNRVTKGSMEIAGAGIKISLTIYQARPNKAYTVADSAATGKVETGTNGEVAWQLSALTGAQVLEGKEKANFLHMNIFDRPVYWRTSFQKVETAGMEDVSGKPCYKVVATPPDLPSQTMFFDKETHLLVRVMATVESQAGTIPADSYISDYRTVDGILMAHRTVTKLMGQERIATLESVEHNVDLPPGRFDLPAEIKAIIKK